MRRTSSATEGYCTRYPLVTSSTRPRAELAFDAYPRGVVDHVLSELQIAPGELVVDARCQLAVGLSAAGALVLAVDTFGLPAEAVASIARQGDAPIHFARGRAEDLPNILARELGTAMHARVVTFGSAFRFMDRRAALEACDRCGAECIALVFGTSAPSPWRAIVADIIVDLARSRITTRVGAKNEALAPIFAGSAFSHISRWQTEMRLERTAEEVATLAAFYALRAGIVVDFAACTQMTRAITTQLRRFVPSVYVEDVTYTVISARRGHGNRLSAHATAQGL